MKLAPCLLLALAACSSANDPSLVDAGPGRDGPRPVDARATDAPPGTPDAPPANGDAGLPYRRTITVDGVDDFTADEQLTTTSAPTYVARVTWDADNLYVGYGGPDLATSAADAGTKWLFVHVDVDPGASTGAAASELYRTQTAAFPTGFGSEHYARYKVDGSFASIKSWSGTAFTDSATAPTTGQAGEFVELAIPRSLFGGAPTLGVVAWMINEKDLGEFSYAGLLAGNFTDAYSPALPLTKYLRVEFAAARTPADPANQITP